MPRNQSTGAKNARAAARQGAKYTQALRSETQEPGDDVAVAAQSLAALVAAGGDIPVRVVPLPDGAQRRTTGWWGTCEAAADGFLVRELDGYPKAPADGKRRPRVPVPVPDGAGRVEVVDVPPIVHRPGGKTGPWVWAHNGWLVSRPGTIADMDHQEPVSAALPFDVREFNLGPVPGVLTEDYHGSPAYWQRIAWCATVERAREVADAAIRWQGRTQRVQAWEHPSAGTPVLAYQSDGVPEQERGVFRKREFGPVHGRPDGPPADLIAEPDWFVWCDKRDRPQYALHVWTPSAGWETVCWCNGRQLAALTAQDLEVGVKGSRYEFGWVSGPNYPRAWAHDWTQEGRACTDLLPDRGTNER